jgi:nickel/cobalt exporter
MAAFVVANRGTARQAALLGVSAAVGHTVIIWLLAFLGLWLGEALVMEAAEPWFVLVSGLLVLGLAGRMIGFQGFRISGLQGGQHDHGHGACGCGHDHGEGEVKRLGRRRVGVWEIIWFGVSGGLMPCPSALAVLLVCLQAGAFSLGFAMVAGFSVGIAATLVAVGVMAAWGAGRARGKWARFDVWSARVPLISAVIVGGIGVVLVGRGVMMLVS